MRNLFLSFVFAVVLASAPGDALGVPVAYDLDLAGASFGSFIVDPDLAAQMGPSGVALATFSITLDTSAGVLSFAPADLTGGFIEARFIDGVLAGLRSPNGTTAEITTQSGDFGIAIFFDTDATTVAQINPAAAGEGNFTVVSLPAVIPVDDVCCLYGFTPAEQQPHPEHPVPEPSSVLLFLVGSAIVATACSRAPRLA